MTGIDLEFEDDREIQPVELTPEQEAKAAAIVEETLKQKAKEYAKRGR